MIKFENVTKTYRTSPRPALDSVSVTIDKGEFVFLIGPSGSGKSSFLQLMVKEEDLTSGDLWVDDFHVNQLKRNKVPLLRQRIGYVFQDFRLLPSKSVYNNVAFALEVIGTRRSQINERVMDSLQMVGLDGKRDRMPSELSGGEQQRVAIARASVNRPMVLLADEPTGNLDPETSTDILTLLNRINQMGTTVVMSTHDASAVDAMRKRVLELELGKLIRDDKRGLYSVGK